MADPTLHTLFYYVVNNGDGSASPKFFTTKEARDVYMKAEEDWGEAFCESDGQLDFAIEDDGSFADARKYTMPDYFEKYGGRFNPKPKPVG